MTDDWKGTFDNLNTPLLISDQWGVVVHANRAACTLASAPEGKVVGSRVDAVSAGEPWQTAMRVVASVAASGTTNSAETSDAQERSWAMTVSRMSDVRFLVALWDMTA